MTSMIQYHYGIAFRNSKNHKLYHLCFKCDMRRIAISCLQSREYYCYVSPNTTLRKISLGKHWILFHISNGIINYIKSFRNFHLKPKGQRRTWFQRHTKFERIIILYPFCWINIDKYNVQSMFCRLNRFLKTAEILFKIAKCRHLFSLCLCFPMLSLA